MKLNIKRIWSTQVVAQNWLIIAARLAAAKRAPVKASMRNAVTAKSIVLLARP